MGTFDFRDTLFTLSVLSNYITAAETNCILHSKVAVGQAESG